MARRILLLFASLVILILLWQGLALGVSTARDVQFPTPGATLVKLVGLLRGEPLCDHVVYRHVLDSLGRWVVGFVIAALLGTAYGLLAGWHRNFEALTVPIVVRTSDTSARASANRPCNSSFCWRTR